MATPDGAAPVNTIEGSTALSAGNASSPTLAASALSRWWDDRALAGSLRLLPESHSDELVQLVSRLAAAPVIFHEQERATSGVEGHLLDHLSLDLIARLDVIQARRAESLSRGILVDCVR